MEFLWFIKLLLITNIQNIPRLNQCTRDMFRHGRSQYFYGPGVPANGLTGVKNILMECLVEAISECGGSSFI
jgi:hypothetical protein